MISHHLLLGLFISLALGSVSLSTFAAAPALTLDYPRGGEAFVAGTLQQVALGAKPKVTPVNVELSLDGGATFTSLGLITVVKSVGPPLSFIVPNTPSGNCVIRVSGTVKGAPVSSLSRAFSIVAVGASGSSGLADGSVTNPKLAPLAVSNDKVTSGAASSDFVLTADGIGNAVWKTLPLSGSNNGPAGGDLTGTYPNPTLAANAVVTAKIGDGQITAAKLAPGIAIPHPTFTQMYLKAGNGTAANAFTVPVGVSSILIEAWGAGGGGGGSSGSNFGAGHGGGGEAPGLYYRGVVSVTPGSYSVVAGTAGAPGDGGLFNSNGGNGGTGGSSIVSVGGGADIMTALGGGGGAGGAPGAGTPGVGGTAPATTTTGVQFAVGGNAGVTTFGGAAAPAVFGGIPFASGGAGANGSNITGIAGSAGSNGMIIISY